MTEEKFSTEKLKKASEMLKVIAHPTRIAIIDFIQMNEKTVTEIYQHLNVEQAVASHHLNLMKSKNILVSNRVGKNTYYSLAYDKILDIVNCIEKCQPSN